MFFRNIDFQQKWSITVTQNGYYSSINNKLKFIMQDNNPDTRDSKTVYGSFEECFNKKFRRRTVKSVSVDRLKLAKMPSGQLTRSTKSTTKSQNMLPRLKQLQKIAKTARRKGIKLNKYLDGISDFDLYMANKQLNNLTTQQLVTQLATRQRRGTEHFEAFNTFYSQFASGNAKFHEVEHQNPETNKLKGMSKTDYASKGKWVSDQELVQKFDKFIVHPQQQQSAHDVPKPKAKLKRQQLAEKISADKAQLTQIAKKMIAEQNHYTEDEQYTVRQPQSKKSSMIGIQQSKEKSIEWILTQCDFYNKKFKIKKGLSKVG